MIGVTGDGRPKATAATGKIREPSDGNKTGGNAARVPFVPWSARRLPMLGYDQRLRK
jgi:hypothetical protein